MKRCDSIKLVFCLLVMSPFFYAQTLCTVTEVRTEITISASAESVWKLLLNSQDYPHWHPYITAIEGELALHKKIKVHTIDQEKKAGQFKAYVLKLEPNKELAWGGSLGFVFRAKHYFIIEVIDSQTVRFIQGEYWRGWFGKMYGKKIYQKTFANFKLMNERMKVELTSGK